MKTGVYQIRNKVNGKRYIGSAAGKNGFDGRWRVHLHHLRNSTHANKHLQNAWNKYNAEAFAFEIVERCKPSECIIREQHHLDVKQPKYNINPNASSRLGAKLSSETKAKISQAHLGKKATPEVAARLRTLRCGKTNGVKQKRAASIANRGSKAPSAKLNESQVREIRSLFGQITQRDIANRFSVSEATVSMIKTRKNWRHI